MNQVSKISNGNIKSSKISQQGGGPKKSKISQVREGGVSELGNSSQVIPRD